MVRTFKQLVERAKKGKMPVIALVCAHNNDIVDAAIKAKKAKIADFILIGDKQEMPKKGDFERIFIKNPEKCALKAMELVNKERADIIMKGLIKTSELFRAAFNHTLGIDHGLVSHITLVENKHLKRLLYVTDGALNIAPDKETLKKIVLNAAYVANKLGVKKPKAALLNTIEYVNEKIPSTVIADQIKKDMRRNSKVIVDGPLAFDDAISLKATKEKGIKSSVSGKADIIVCPDIICANSLLKAIIYMTASKAALIAVGARVPIILTSRSDSVENRFHSICLAKLLVK